MSTTFGHIPVLLDETMTALQPAAHKAFIDATIGGGGHALRLLALSEPDGIVLGIDADPVAIEATSQRLLVYADRVTLVESYFDELLAVAHRFDFPSADGVLFDFGVSSPQLDTAQRGFSFQQDAPLDMRFGPSVHKTAADFVNNATASELQRLFQEFGEERYAGRIARHIVEDRGRHPIRTTGELARLVAHAVPPSRHDRLHPATRVFQALRIAVNDELARIERALPQAVEALRAGGRLVVISFHSLEDRLVKQFIQRESRACVCPPSLPVCVCDHAPTLRPISRRPVTATEAETTINPRARSAKLRIAEKVA